MPVGGGGQRGVLLRIAEAVEAIAGTGEPEDKSKIRAPATDLGKSIVAGMKKIPGMGGKEGKAAKLGSSISKAGEFISTNFGVLIALQMGIQALGRIVGEFNQLQVQSLAVGRQLSDVYSESVKAHGELPGGMMMAMGEQIQSMQIGFRGNNTEMVKLGMAMKATGQQSDLLYSAMLNAEVLGGLTRDQTGKLSSRIAALADSGMATATQMVNAIESLRGVFLNAQLLGIGDQIATATAELTALVPMSAQLLTEGMRGLLSTDMKDITGIMILGGRQMHADFARGHMDAVQVGKFMHTLGKNFGKRVEANDGIYNALQGLGITMDQFHGRLGAPLKAWAEQLERAFPGEDMWVKIEKRLKDVAISTEQWRLSMEVWTNEVWDPLKRVGIKLFSGMMTLISGNVPWITKLIKWTIALVIALRLNTWGRGLSGGKGLAAGFAALATKFKIGKMGRGLAWGGGARLLVASLLKPLLILGGTLLAFEWFLNIGAKKQLAEAEKTRKEAEKQTGLLEDPLHQAALRGLEAANRAALNQVFNNFLGSNTPQMDVLLEIRENTGDTATGLRRLTEEEKKAAMAAVVARRRAQTNN